MKSRTCKVVVGVVGAVAALIIAGEAAFLTMHSETGVDVPTQINEDDPGWQCATMGNRICGPDLDAALAACDTQVPEFEANDICRLEQLDYWYAH